MTDFLDLQRDVLEWAHVKGILAKSDIKTQLCKTMEELGETMGAVLKGNQEEIIDGIGDMVVTLIIASHISGLDIVQCLDSANNVIQKRSGLMVDGVFVKDAPKDLDKMQNYWYRAKYGQWSRDR